MVTGPEVMQENHLSRDQSADENQRRKRAFVSQEKKGMLKITGSSKHPVKKE